MRATGDNFKRPPSLRIGVLPAAQPDIPAVALAAAQGKKLQLVLVALLQGGLRISSVVSVHLQHGVWAAPCSEDHQLPGSSLQ